MDDLESIVITGTAQFSSYAGYAQNFSYTGPYHDVDEDMKRCVSIVAMDALTYSRTSSARQFERESILRELNKAYSGFSCRVPGDDPLTHALVPVATGNWGCGAFKGDKSLKTLIQWLAASRAGRTLKYYTFNDKTLSRRQAGITQRLLQEKLTVGRLFEVLVSDSRERDVFQSVDRVH
jgi:poly(ADP-ribose) glycohydrolase